MKISKSNLLIIVVIVGTYIVWFVFFQDVIKFILNNAIESETGELDIITGWMGVIILPALIAFCLIGIIAGIGALIKRARKSEM